MDLNEVPKSKMLNHNLADLFLSNQVSGQRAATLFQDASASGSSGMWNLTKVGDHKHQHRNLLMKFLKVSKWPQPYMANVRVWDNASETEYTHTIPILLPHELIQTLAKWARGKLFEMGGADPPTHKSSPLQGYPGAQH